MMKYVSILLIAGIYSFSTFSQKTDPDIFFQKADQFFKDHVKEGLVKYNDIKDTKSDLEQLTRTIGSIDINDINSSQEKAFLINAYNILAIQSIIDHYPVASPLNIEGFFEDKIHHLGKQKVSLDNIEKDLLLKKFPDERIHFVLVCAAKGCPPLANYAFLPEQLDRQLTQQTTKALNDPDFVKINRENKKVLLSKIFEWYASDFIAARGSLPAYINSYRTDKIPAEYSIGYYAYDWSLNAYKSAGPASSEKSAKQTFNPINYTPSILLSKGRFEVQVFNNLYTQRSYFNTLGENTLTNSRASYYTGIFRFTYGASPKFNLGLDVYLRSVRLDGPSSSALSIFRFEDSPDTRTAVSVIALKIKFLPFKKVKRLSVLSHLLIPITSDPQGVNNGKPFLDWDKFIWWTQNFYDQRISDQFQLFTELDLMWFIDKKLKKNASFFRTPVKAFFSFFPSDRSSFYVMGEFTPTWGDQLFRSYYAQSGLGAKYQVLPQVEIEFLATDFLYGKNEGAGVTYNLGVRYVK